MNASHTPKLLLTAGLIAGLLALASCRPADRAPSSEPAARRTTNAAPARPESGTTSAATNPPTAEVPSTNAPALTSTNALAAASTNAPAPPSTNAPAPPRPGGEPGAADEIQLSFQGANIDMIVQWLAKTTGKSVLKHPRVQCQLTIVSSKNVPTRQAINLVYHALALEGFSAVETAKSILILPEGQDAKMIPEVLNSSQKDLPEGRQRLVKVFPLEYVQAADLREKVRVVLSEKATIEIDQRANQMIVSDFNENLRLLAELVKELDVASRGDTVVEIFPLKYAEADELGSMLGQILNAQFTASPATPSRPSPTPSGPSPGGPPMISGPPSPMPGPPSSSASTPPSGSPTQVRIWPDKTANRLIVSTPQSKLPEIQKLVEILDTKKPQDVTVRVIPLKNVQAVDLAKEIGPLYQRMRGNSLKETIEVAANERSNSLIVLSSESNFQALQKLTASLDTDDAQEKTTRTFPLKHADAQDVAKQLQQLSRDQDSSSRYPYYVFFGSSQGGAAKKTSVVADRRRNALVVQAPPAQMEGLARMIQELDEPVTDDSLAPRIYPLKYVSAVDIEDVLNELFLRKQQQRSYWDYYDSYYPESTADRDVGRLYGKVRITSEPYSNTIIVTSNSKENLAVVEEVLKQLDVPSQAGETTLRVPLRFAKAATVANNLNILFAKGGSPPLRQVGQQPQPNQAQPQPQAQSTPTDTSFGLERETKEEGYYPWLGGQPDTQRASDGRTTTRQVSDMIGRVRVVADLRSNALLVSANMHLLPQVMKLVEELDAPTPQVLIEARIVEVSSDFLDKLGVRWSPDGNKVFTPEDYDNSLLARADGQYQKGFGGNTAINSSPTGSLPGVLSSLRSGVLSSTISMDYLIQFLRKTIKATVLAEPQINIADNETGRLFVGQQVPFIDRSQTTDVGALNQSFQYKPVGIILEVTPHINNTGDVALKIRAESSAIQPGQTLFGGAILDTRNFRTDVTTKNGETLVLGGIIQKQVSDTVRKVPLLGSIPALGWAFKKKDKTTREVELMVFLRPKITRTPEEAKALLEELDQKAPLLKNWRQGLPPTDRKDKKGEE